MIYFGKNIVQYIPSPFDGVYNVSHKNMTELKDMAYMCLFIMLFQYNLYDKLISLRKKSNSKIKV
jgi:hypothetical protein